MPHYFFDVRDSMQIRDEVGRDLADVEAARQEAVSLAADFASNPQHLSDNGWIVVTVRDGPQNVVLKVRIVCSIEVTAEQTVEDMLDRHQARRARSREP